MGFLDKLSGHRKTPIMITVLAPLITAVWIQETLFECWYAVTTQERLLFKKNFFCTGALLFPCLQLYFTELIKNSSNSRSSKSWFSGVWFKCNHSTLVRAKKVFLTFHVTAVTSRVRLLFKKNFLGPENCGFYSREVTKREHLIKDIQLLS